MHSSVRPGRIAGIEIGIHYTWLFAFVLVAWSLADGYFPSDAPGLSPTTVGPWGWPRPSSRSGRSWSTN